MKYNDWKGKDKLLHFGVCLAIAIISPQAASGDILGEIIWRYEGKRKPLVLVGFSV